MRMRRSSRVFTKEFREKAIMTAMKSPLPNTEVAKEFGITGGMLNGWITRKRDSMPMQDVRAFDQMKADAKERARSRMVADLRSRRYEFRKLENQHDQFQFIQDLSSKYPAPGICRYYRVSVGSFYAWRKKTNQV